MKSWAVSLAAHGTVLGLALALWPEAPPEAEPEPFRWEVAFAPVPPPPAPPRPVQAAPIPTPAKPIPKPLPQILPAFPPTPPPTPRTPPSEPVVERPPPAPTPVTPAPIAAQPVEAAARPEPSPAPVVAAPQPVRSGPSPAELAAEAAAGAAMEAERRWYAALLGQLRRLKHYPLVARRLGQEGVVLLTVTIAADGQVETVAVKRGSGHTILDREALKLLQEAAAAARAETRPGRPSQLEIPIAYRLREG